ncbi:MAG: 4-hydroxy-tetrahydrodipicolinate reductase [Acidimicrobiales bacterium]
MRVGVLGAGGRMGAEACRAVAGDPALTLVAAVDPHHAGGHASGVTIAAEVDALAAAGAEVAVHFTLVDAARENLAWCAAHGVHAVVGTSGLTGADLDELRASFPVDGEGPNCLVVPNFAIGAVLMMRFAEMAAPFFETAEIIELHHDGKADAPSGTAIATAGRMAAASSDWTADAGTDEVLPGARGGSGAAGIKVHSVRLRGLVAHQEVLLGTTGQTLSIRHDTTDRSCFMPGVLLAVKAVAGRPGLTVGLDSLLW